MEAGGGLQVGIYARASLLPTRARARSSTFSDATLQRAVGMQ